MSQDIGVDVLQLLLTSLHLSNIQSVLLWVKSQRHKDPQVSLVIIGVPFNHYLYIVIDYECMIKLLI